MLTTLLELAGMVLLVAAALTAFGPAAGLTVAGLCCLGTSWRLSR